MRWAILSFFHNCVIHNIVYQFFLWAKFQEKMRYRHLVDTTQLDLDYRMTKVRPRLCSIDEMCLQRVKLEYRRKHDTTVYIMGSVMQGIWYKVIQYSLANSFGSLLVRLVGILFHYNRTEGDKGCQVLDFQLSSGMIGSLLAWYLKSKTIIALYDKMIKKEYNCHFHLFFKIWHSFKE